ncbi:MAG TPA: CBS domain-containing protein [Nitrososphaeraceae archaeon]|nr:CBS domain-containing protein [Nitrososphaeraceae archaeon]
MYSNSLSQKAGDLIERNFATLHENANVVDAIRLMNDKNTSSIIVNPKDSEEPIGIVTERDILYRVVAESKDPSKTTLKEIMSSPILTINKDVLVNEAVSIMRKEGIRRLVVVTDKNKFAETNLSSPTDEKGKTTILGVLTLMSIIGESSNQSINLADIDIPDSIIASKNIVIVCPYCESKFDNKADLSKHIDRIHIGAGLLEGNMRQW